MTSFGPHFDAAALRDLAPELAEAFSQASFTTDGLAGHLGPELTEALYRGEPAAVARGTAGNTKLDTLIRFFLLHEHLPATLLADALGARLAAKLLDAGVALSDDCGSIYIALDIRPHIIVGSNRLVFSDVDASLVSHVPGADHVLGVGAASLSLLQSTPVSPVSTVLDLGTGSGVQLLGQLECARSITATDVHRRALDLAGATVAAAGASTEVELVEGSWFEPVAGRTFDRIVANPPVRRWPSRGGPCLSRFWLELGWGKRIGCFSGR